VNGRGWRWRWRTILTLITAALALGTGVQALAPSPAAAWLTEDEEICNGCGEIGPGEAAGDPVEDDPLGVGGTDSSNPADSDPCANIGDCIPTPGDSTDPFKTNPWEETGDACLDYGNCWDQWNPKPDNDPLHGTLPPPPPDPEPCLGEENRAVDAWQRMDQTEGTDAWDAAHKEWLNRLRARRGCYMDFPSIYGQKPGSGSGSPTPAGPDARNDARGPRRGPRAKRHRANSHA
jgi:hypothetical protein